MSQGLSLGHGWSARVPGTVPGTRLEASRRAEPALVRARRDDLGDLVERELELVVAREVVGAEADPGVRAEVAEHLPLRQLLVRRLELRDVHRHRASAPLGLARRADLEPARLRAVDQMLRLPQRVGANPVDADL